jgi:hypothetical protein
MPRRIAAIAWLLALLHAPTAPAQERPVGVAQVDITPDGPIRLTGYGNRREPATAVDQRLRAKALAIGGDAAPGPVVLVVADNCGVPARLVEEVARRLESKAKLPRDRLVVCSSHTHNGPALSGVLPFLFGEPIPADHQAAIDGYTRRLADRLEAVALAALADRRPGRLAWGWGEVGIAANRRVLKGGKWTGFGVNPDGPTDRRMPLLRVTDPDGALRAVMLNVACHCTTLTGESNAVSGDWSGYAQLAVERDHPGAVALITIGCGADANPEPRGQDADARAHGEAVAREVGRVLGGALRPLDAAPASRVVRTALPFAPAPTREQLAARATEPGAAGMHARHWLGRLDAGESLPTTLPYVVQSITFGDDLAMVFLAGEVVVDYALLLRAEGDPGRLWITAYANDVPCYIASRRILDEGGYEADQSMLFYGRPGRLAPEAEDAVLRAAWSALPEGFRKPSR